MDQEYSQSQVWQILTEHTNDVDEALDVEAALDRLPEPQRSFLAAISRGYSVLEAMKRVGMHGNQTHVKRAAIKMLADELNGKRGEINEDISKT